MATIAASPLDDQTVCEVLVLGVTGQKQRHIRAERLKGALCEVRERLINAFGCAEMVA